MVSVLVGIVFFTFAASFIYFRLYTDLNRDQQQYKMISKMGLSKRELKNRNETVSINVLLTNYHCSNPYCSCVYSTATISQFFYFKQLDFYFNFIYMYTNFIFLYHSLALSTKAL